MDQGVIHSLKVKYRSLAVKKQIRNLETKGELGTLSLTKLSRTVSKKQEYQRKLQKEL